MAREWGARVLDALGSAPICVSAALPRRSFPPRLSRYADGQSVDLDGTIYLAAEHGIGNAHVV